MTHFIRLWQRTQTFFKYSRQHAVEHPMKSYVPLALLILLAVGLAGLPWHAPQTIWANEDDGDDSVVVFEKVTSSRPDVYVS